MTDHPSDTASNSFQAAMREQILATALPAPHNSRLLLQRLNRWARPRRRQLGVLSGASMILAATIAVIVLAFGATTNAPPAYALTRHPDGSITITLSELTTGIPALNAKLEKLGIDETVIPITADCSTRGSGNLVMHPNPMYEYNGSISTTYTPRAAQRHPAPPGFHYVLAAKRLPNGKLLGFIGALKPPIPACLPYSSTPSNWQP
jgi:hypothetical protein